MAWAISCSTLNPVIIMTSRRGPDLLISRKRLDPVDARQLDVEQHEVEVAVAEAVERLFAAMRELDRVAAHLEHVGEALGVVAVVVDDQDARFHAATFASVCAAAGGS